MKSRSARQAAEEAAEEHVMSDHTAAPFAATEPPPEGGAQPAVPEAAPSTEAEKAAPPVYVVAPGHSITSRRGTLHAGEVIEPRYLRGGDEVFAKLVEAQSVVPQEPPK